MNRPQELLHLTLGGNFLSSSLNFSHNSSLSTAISFPASLHFPLKTSNFPLRLSHINHFPTRVTKSEGSFILRRCVHYFLTSNCHLAADSVINEKKIKSFWHQFLLFLFIFYLFSSVFQELWCWYAEKKC